MNQVHRSMLLSRYSDEWEPVSGGAVLSVTVTVFDRNSDCVVSDLVKAKELCPVFLDSVQRCSWTMRKIWRYDRQIHRLVKPYLTTAQLRRENYSGLIARLVLFHYESDTWCTLGLEVDLRREPGDRLAITSTARVE
jgi:hypothetical protein